MTVLKYMARQCKMIESRHAGEAYLFVGDGAVMVNGRTASDIMGEIDAMKGLNLAERMAERRQCAFAD